MKPKIIACCGRARAGKTTLCEDIQSLLAARRYTAKILPFAKPLKDTAVELGWNGVKDEKGRALLQRLGTDVCRDCIDPDYWVKKWDLMYSKSMTDFVLVDDMRFENELELVRSLGARVLKVHRPKGFFGEIRDWFLRLTGRMHPSEIGFANEEVDEVISNAGDLADLYYVALRLTKEEVGR